MVEIVLVCCELWRTECRIRFMKRCYRWACQREALFHRIRNNISNAFVCLSVYIKKIYTDVFEWSLRKEKRNQFLYLVTKPFTVLISIIYNEAKGACDWAECNYITINTNYTKVWGVSKLLISRWFFVWDPPSS